MASRDGKGSVTLDRFIADEIGMGAALDPDPFGKDLSVSDFITNGDDEQDPDQDEGPSSFGGRPPSGSGPDGGDFPPGQDPDDLGPDLGLGGP